MGVTVWKAPLRPSQLVRRLRLPLLAGALLLALSGCSEEAQDQWTRLSLPDPASDHGQTVLTLWRGAWIAALIVGGIVWFLILYSCAVFRRRSRDERLPAQVRYNLPVEVIYTAAPIIVVMTFFYFTARDSDRLREVTNTPAVQIDVVGKRWSWDFNYQDADVYDRGIPARRPTLYLPVNERVRFTIDSRDVVHSFWVPAFLDKLDAIPGKKNTLELTPTKVGTFAGKCAELCGYLHARMLFDVKVVDRAEYDRHMQDLRARGQVGELPADIGPRSQLQQGDTSPGGSENRR